MPLKTLSNVPGLRWWVDIDDVDNTTIVGGKLSAFADKSTTGIDGSQGTDAERPTMSTLNGKAIAVADGTNDFILLSGSGVPITTDMAVAAIINRSASGTMTVPVGSSSSSYVPSYYWHTSDNLYIGLGSSYQILGNDTGTGASVLVAARNSTITWCRKNGELFGTPGTAPSVGTGYLNFLFRVYNVYGAGGIGEVAVFPSSEIELVEGILAWDWGLTLPTDHLYYDAAPSYDASSGVDGSIVGSISLSGLISAETYNAAIAGTISLSGSITASTYNASIDSVLRLSGIMDAGYTNLDVEGAIKLSGIIEAANEAIGTINGSLKLSGAIDAVSTVPLSVNGSIALSGVISAYQYSVAAMTGTFKISGLMAFESNVIAEMSGTIHLHSYITANNGAAACTIQPYGSSLWC